jgi:hypothetical protein
VALEPLQHSGVCVGELGVQVWCPLCLGTALGRPGGRRGRQWLVGARPPRSDCLPEVESADGPVDDLVQGPGRAGGPCAEVVVG